MNYLNQSLSRWMEGDGPHSAVVISSRVRLARNISDHPFPGRADATQLEEVERKVRRWWNNGGLKSLGEVKYLSIKDLPANELHALVDKHLVSPNLATGGHGAVLVNQEESVSIMVNEEDHFRIQSLLSGLQLGEAWRLASQVDDFIDVGFRYAWAPEIGYLTCCPTNVGTGMRASVMLHLPGLALSGQLAVVLATISKVGIMVRGLYGEGSEAQGNIYQISNQTTLGQSEEEIIEALNRVTLQVVRQELDARQKVLEQNRIGLMDRIWRSYGILANARIMASTEALEHLSNLRLGIDLKILDNINPRILLELLVLTRPGFLQKIFDQELTPRNRDIKRAELIRDLINNRSNRRSE
jgi:protein arginine kinase